MQWIKTKTRTSSRKSGKSRRYSWDYDENYELFLYDLNTNKYEQITNSIGYDVGRSNFPWMETGQFSAPIDLGIMNKCQIDKKLFEKEQIFQNGHLKKKY